MVSLSNAKQWQEFTQHPLTLKAFDGDHQYMTEVEAGKAMLEYMKTVMEFKE